MVATARTTMARRLGVGTDAPGEDDDNDPCRPRLPPQTAARARRGRAVGRTHRESTTDDEDASKTKMDCIWCFETQVLPPLPAARVVLRAPTAAPTAAFALARFLRAHAIGVSPWAPYTTP